MHIICSLTFVDLPAMNTKYSYMFWIFLEPQWPLKLVSKNWRVHGRHGGGLPSVVNRLKNNYISWSVSCIVPCTVLYNIIIPKYYGNAKIPISISFILRKQFEIAWIRAPLLHCPSGQLQLVSFSVSKNHHPATRTITWDEAFLFRIF